MWYIILKTAEAKEKGKKGKKKKLKCSPRKKRHCECEGSVMEMLTDFSSEPLI